MISIKKEKITQGMKTKNTYKVCGNTRKKKKEVICAIFTRTAVFQGSKWEFEGISSKRPYSTQKATRLTTIAAATAAV